MTEFEKGLRLPTDKYQFRDGGIYHEDGYRVPDNEPVLLFRGKDLGSLAAITAYLDMLCEQHPSEAIKSHLLSMLRLSEAFNEYQHRNDVRSVGCSLEAHKATIKGLRADFNESFYCAKRHLYSSYNIDFDEYKKQNYPKTLISVR